MYMYMYMYMYMFMCNVVTLPQTEKERSEAVRIVWDARQEPPEVLGPAQVLPEAADSHPERLPAGCHADQRPPEKTLHGGPAQDHGGGPPTATCTCTKEKCPS